MRRSIDKLSAQAVICCVMSWPLLSSCGGITPPTQTFRLDGQVTDSATGAPLAGATVNISDGPNAGKSITTSNSGTYSFTELQRSGFTVSVSANLYFPQAKAITLTSNQTVSFQLVRQTVEPPTLPCVYSLSIGSTIDGYPNGGSFSVTVTTTAGCTWIALSSVSWIHTSDPSSRNGTGTLTFTVDANSGSPRTGTLTIAGKAVTFNQTATTSANRPPTSGTIQASFGAGVVAFTTFTFSARGVTDPDGDPITFKWDFGDGTSGSGATVTKTYTTAGTPTIRVSANDGHNPDVPAAPISVLVRTLTAQWTGTAVSMLVPCLSLCNFSATFGITQTGRTLSATCTSTDSKTVFPFAFSAGYPHDSGTGGLSIFGDCRPYPGPHSLLYEAASDRIRGVWGSDWTVTLSRR